MLPLGDERTMLSAAQHVSELNLSRKKTEACVRGLRESSGKPRHLRITPSALHARIRSVRDRLGGAPVARRLAAMRAEMDPKEREAWRRTWWR